MDHPHIDNLLQQLEEFRERREVRDARPDRLTQFISDVAEAFEPTHGVARVGFQCEPKSGIWAVRMYLGTTEVVGGRDDGLVQDIGFQFDIDAAIAQFTNVESISFCSQPSEEKIDSGVLIRGEVDEFPVQLSIHSVPPDEAGPGFQRMPDRSLRLT